MANDDRRAKPRWQAILLALGLFVLGVATGLAAPPLLRGQWPGGPRRPWPEHDALRLSHIYRGELDLDEAQTQAVERILRDRWQQMAQVFVASEPQIDGIRQRADAAIRALLSGPQLPRFEALRTRIEDRRADMARRLKADAAGTPLPDPPPPGPPPDGPPGP